MAALLLFLQPAAAGEKVSPPDMTSALRSLEKAGSYLEKEDWDAASGELLSLQKTFSRLIRENKTEGETIYRFGYTIGRLQVSLMNRDRVGSEENLVELHAMMLRFAERYAHSVPPALAAIDDSLRRCQGSLEGEEFKEIVYKLRGVGRFFRLLYKNLEARGVTNTELWEYHRRINTVMAACEAANASLTGRGLTELRVRTDRFFALFEGAGLPEEAGDPGR